MINKKTVLSALSKLGNLEGETILIQSNLSNFGRVKDCFKKKDTLNFFYDCIMDTIGKKGTLLVLTSFENYARYGHAFDKKLTKSMSGAFSEYIRTKKGSFRSSHPVLSVSGIGSKAKEICEGNHFDGFGYDSPWGRIHRNNAMILSMGYSLAPDGMTFLHYVENLYGVPYQYNKVYDYPVLDNGKQLSGIFSMSVRYLDFEVENDQTKFKTILLKKGLAKKVKCGRSEIFGAKANDIVGLATQLFSKNRYVLLKKPPRFRRGEIPFDVKETR